MGYVPDVMRKKVYDTNENQKVDTAEDADTVDGIQGNELLKRDGSLAMTGDLDLGGKDIKNITNLILSTAGDNLIHLFDSSNAANRFKIKRTGTALQFIYYDSSDVEHVVAEFLGENTFDLKNHTLDYVDVITPGGSSKEIGTVSLPFENLYTKNAYLDTIYERQTDSGVTIDGCLIKDGKAEQAVSVTGIVKQRLTINAGESFTINSGECMTVILPPGEEFTINGSLTIQDGGRFILFGL